MKKWLWKIVKTSLLAIPLLYFGAVIYSQVVIEKKPTTQLATATRSPQQLSVDSINIYELWESTNKYRADKGLQGLNLSPLLNRSATDKCNDMVKNDYWSHGEPNKLRNGIEKYTQFSGAGENLAYGYLNAHDVTEGWVNSDRHRVNLEAQFDNVGFAVCKSDNYVSNGQQLIVVQHFTQD